MTKIQQGQSPQVTQTSAQPLAQTPETASPSHGFEVVDTLGPASQVSGRETAVPANLQIPLSLRPISTRGAERLLAFHPFGLESGEISNEGGQAEAVAKGAVGLIHLPSSPPSPHGGLWESPVDHFADMSSLSAGAQHTMALLQRIDHHLDALALALGVES